MFVGRETELKLLNDAYRSEKDEKVLDYPHVKTIC